MTDKLILSGQVIDLNTVDEYITYFSGYDSEFILKAPEGLLIHKQERGSQMKETLYKIVTASEVCAWLDGRPDVSFMNLEEAIQLLGLRVLGAASDSESSVADDTPST